MKNYLLKHIDNIMVVAGVSVGVGFGTFAMADTMSALRCAACGISAGGITTAILVCHYGIWSRL